MVRIPPSVIGIGGVLGLFVTIYLLGIAALTPLLEAGVEAGTDPTDPRLGLVFVVGLLVASAGMFLAFRWGLDQVIRGFVLFVAIGLIMLVVDILLPSVLHIAGFDVLAVAIALGLGLSLLVFPRWYIIDAVGILLGAGAVALFGITLGVLPALVLLVILAIYDAISVYGTKHMLSLAEGAMRSRLPVLLIVPVSMGSLGRIKESLEEADIVVIGLGDAIIPGMLVGAAVAHGPGTAWVIGGLALTPAAIGTIVGIGIGVVLLFAVLARGGAHPGLPILNTGAIGGYLAGAAIDGIRVGEAIGLTLVM